jgi:hypothetical protein
MYKLNLTNLKKLVKIPGFSDMVIHFCDYKGFTEVQKLGNHTVCRKEQLTLLLNRFNLTE